MCFPKFNIFLIFLFFPKILSLKSFGNSWGDSYTKFAALDTNFSFKFWWIECLLKYCKVPKYYDQDCLKTFFLLSLLPIMIQISGKSAHLDQKCYFYQETTNKQSWKLPKFKLWPKSSIQDTASRKPFIWTLAILTFLYFYWKVRKFSENKENVINWSWRKTGLK